MKNKGNTKYKIGDILYNPPNTAATYKVIGLQTIDGVLNYVLLWQEQGIQFTARVDVVDVSSEWAKL